MLHRLIHASAPIRHQASRLRAPDFTRSSHASFHVARPRLRILSPASPQMASSEQSLSAAKTNAPRAPSPSQGTGTARANVSKTQLTNHPQAMMVSNSVNKTALHPGGVQYASPAPRRASRSNHGQAHSGAHRAGRGTARDSRY
jgi:hypothetical protein